LVDIIDINQWQYRKDGSLYAPIGGESLAPRQYERIVEVGETSFSQIYRAVNELRTKYPEKAVVYNRAGVRLSNWAAFIAGGSFAALPKISDASFFENAATMGAVTMVNPESQQYALGKTGTGYIIFCESKKLIIDLSADKTKYFLKWINPATGEILLPGTRIPGGTKTTVNAPFEGAAVAWLCRK